MTNSLIPITEEAKLYLTCWGHGNEHRFAILFQKAWNRLPATKRFVLTRYWEHQGYAHNLVCREFNSSPRIELVSGWKDRDTVLAYQDREWRQAPAGEVFACGYLLRFCAPSIDRMPHEVVQDVVAQHLAWCWQYADSIINHTPRCWDVDKLEREAAEVMRSWGFNSESPTQWTAQSSRAMAV